MVGEIMTVGEINVQESMTASKSRTANGIGGAVGLAARRRWIIS